MATQVDAMDTNHVSQPTPLSTSSLESLQSTEQRDLMDLVDRLRRAGLSSIVQLPQIVVCGDQSSGKSSVLEAITEIPFPRKENLCTRFATEIVMRRDSNTSISCRINPDDSNPEDLQRKLRAFSKSIQNFDELPDLIDEATTLMGLDGTKAFSRDVLSIEICGPNRPQLTLVDLPGLIHAANKSQSDEDVELIKTLVEDYVSKERTIVLAVISAKNDYANQIILKRCRVFDPKGARTLGVITKPDYLRPDSENESVWLDLAQNRDIYFELGWHILRNRTDEEHHFSFAQRNTAELSFLSTGNYKSLPRRMKGISTLRERLSKLLFDHLKKELPKLKSELDDLAAKVFSEVELLGKSRSTQIEQRVYLTELFTSAYNILQMGIHGNYEDDFFGEVDTTKAIAGDSNAYRLRAVVQFMNSQFAQQMCKQGHRYYVIGDDKDAGNVADGDEFEQFFEEYLPKVTETPASALQNGKPKSVGKPVHMTRGKAIDWVISIMLRTRGRELPGTFNPMLISHLFWDQSGPWEGLARRHIKLVAAACQEFLLSVLSHVSAADVKTKLLNLTALPALKCAREAALKELDIIIEDKKRHPITYNHYFTDTLQKIQNDRYNKKMTKLTTEATVTGYKVGLSSMGMKNEYTEQKYLDPRVMQKGLEATIEQNMDKVSAMQALDAHNAYYKDERKYFIGVITKQVVERHLVTPLADILSPKVAAGYSEKEIHFLAAEPPEATQMREHLTNKKKMLEDGQEAFSVAIGQHI